MANASYTINTTSMIADIKTALQTQYGSGNVTIHYETTAYLIFSCSAISNKVIKIYFYATATSIQFYYGDAYTSGSTITNQVQFCGYSSTYNTNVTAIYLVCGDSFCMFNYLAGSVVVSGLAIIGKMSNDSYICIGLLGAYSDSTYCQGRDTTNGVAIYPITVSNGFTDVNNKLYRMGLAFRNASNLLLINSDNSIATLAGIYNVSFETGTSTIFKAASNIITTSRMFMGGLSIVWLPTALFVEW